ncbi:MAG: single-stranded DNA-binding protein, partial [Candidatus Omnitrophica bacterium]|nr:single-stranded DNA-binding protein [Candidatus Omnitrophota bacterium]
GSQIGVQGSLQMRKFQDKDGNNRTTYDVIVENFQFLDSKGSGGGGGSFQGPQGNQGKQGGYSQQAPPAPSYGPGSGGGGMEPPPDNMMEDDLPF